MNGQIDKAITEGKRAIALDPNGADTLVGQVDALKIADQPEEALKLMEKAMRLNPKPPALYYWLLGTVYHMLGRYEEAITAYEPIFSHEAEYMSYMGRLGLAFANLELGHEIEARNHAAEALKIRPDSLVQWAAATLRYKDVEHLKRLAKPLDSLQYADAGKREVYVNEGPPFFKFQYPAGSVKQAHLFPHTEISMKLPGSHYVYAMVWDVSDNMSLADFASLYLVEEIKNHKLSLNFKVISNNTYYPERWHESL